MDVNNFGQLNADVWGTVSDWVMVIVTAATGLLIYLTLKSQRKVQHLQQTITLVETKRYLNEIRPNFTTETRLVNPNGCQLILVPIDNKPFELFYKITHATPGFIDLNTDFDLKKADLTVGAPLSFGFLFPEDLEEGSLICMIDFFYKDQIGSTYSLSTPILKGRQVYARGPNLISDKFKL